MADKASKQPFRPGLGYGMTGLILLLAAWNGFAAGFGDEAAEGWVVHGNYRADGSEGTHLSSLVSRLPAANRPRLLVLGNSQMKTVKREEVEDRRLGLGGQLAERLERFDVIDLSSGGQQAAESLVVLANVIEPVEPDVVLLGVGGFSMRKATVRPRLAAQLTATGALEASLEGAPSPWVAQTARLRASLGSGDPEVRGASSRGETVQASVDAQLGSWLDRLPAVRHRGRLYDELIDRPFRRDGMRWLSQRVGGARLARTIVLTSGFDASIASVGLAARICEQRGIPLVLVQMPYDATRPPIVYRPEEAERLLGALKAIQRAVKSAVIVDLSDALAPERFGEYVDGSRDALHFDRNGHRELSILLSPIVRSAVRGDGPA